MAASVSRCAHDVVTSLFLTRVRLGAATDIRLQFRHEALREELSTVHDYAPTTSSPKAGPLSPALQPITHRMFAPSPSAGGMAGQHDFPQMALPK